MCSLPEEKLSQLRQVIHTRVSQGDTLEKIKACLQEVLAREGGRYCKTVPIPQFVAIAISFCNNKNDGFFETLCSVFGKLQSGLYFCR